MNVNPRKFCLKLLATLLILIPLAEVMAESPPPLAEEWLFTIKQGQMKEFLGAVKDHIAIRAENDDPFAWDVYRSHLGDGMNKIAIRYCCLNWSDVDSYVKWEGDHPDVMAHWMEKVDPYVEKTEHYFDEIDWGNSHWSEKGGPYRYFGVTEFKPMPGHSAKFDQAREKMSQIAINQGWATDSRSWIWTTSIGGYAKESIVVPYTNFAGLAGGDESFFEFLSRHMGSVEAAADLFQQFEASTRGSSFQIWEHLPGLSMQKED